MRVALLSPPLRPDGPAVRPRHWPLFALSTAAALREAGHAVVWRDAHLEAPAPARVARELLAEEPDALVLFASDYNRRIPVDSLGAHLAALQRAAPGLPVLLGGRHSPDEARRLRLALPGARAVAAGEPEGAARAFVAGGGPGLVASVDQVVVPADGAAIPEAPAWDLAGPGRYAFSPHQSGGDTVFPVLVSRGCPYGCFFCEVRAQPGWAGRPVADVLRELRALQARFGARSFFFADPMFGLHRGPTVELCEAVAPLGLRWSAMCRTDRVDPGLLRAMAAAGCWSVLFGVETLNPAAQRATGKHLDPATVGPAVRAARDAGLEVIVSAVIGLPGDDPAGVRRTVDGIIDLEPDFAQFFPAMVPEAYAAPGGAPAPAAGPDDAFAFNGLPYVGAGFAGPAEVDALCREAFRRFYLRPRYVRGRLRALRRRPGAELPRALAGLRIAVSRMVPAGAATP